MQLEVRKFDQASILQKADQYCRIINAERIIECDAFIDFSDLTAFHMDTLADQISQTIGFRKLVIGREIYANFPSYFLSKLC